MSKFNLTFEQVLYRPDTKRYEVFMNLTGLKGFEDCYIQTSCSDIVELEVMDFCIEFLDTQYFKPLVRPYNKELFKDIEGYTWNMVLEYIEGKTNVMDC